MRNIAVKKILIDRGLTVTQLALACGYRRDQVSMCINGIRRYEHIRRRIAEVLGLEYDKLWPEEAMLDRKSPDRDEDACPTG